MATGGHGGAHRAGDVFPRHGMKPAAFCYVRPRDLDELLATLAEGDVLLAGGQSLVPQLNARERRALRLVDLGAVTELSRCEIGPDRVVLGALTRHHDLASRGDLRAAVPVLAQAGRHRRPGA